ncbi:hypothetical protein [Streptomyces gibsoniae]|uniref:Resolvase/invertase-type recombinase catalytic domain-containing protein n=1 Tax=Streptomyces gibsoniae TaxID=3075529 RepID=A0ABU2U1Q9_9ACTN|nr:hypothetical protein [Streptomyces sp. DSM 41699]MDT0467113.1 hypothetical protein [Streptomyces sp. DSM 41699]
MLTESSTCADYLRVSQDDRARFIEHEMQVHQPQTNAPVTLSSQFAPGGTPTAVSGNAMMNEMGAAYLGPILDSECPHKLSTKIVVLLAPAWTASPRS